MNSKLVGLVVLIGVGLTACNTNPYSSEIKHVDSLKVELNEAKMKLDSVDLKKLGELSSTATQQLSFIQKNYQDTMSKDLASLLGFYKQTYRNMQKLANKTQQTQEELVKSEEQLENLSADLANELIPKDSVNFYIQREERVTKEIKTASTQWIDAQERYISYYDSTYPRVDSLLDVMKQNGMR